MKKMTVSFLNAFAGLRHTWRNEKNFRIEMICGCFVCGCGIIFQIKKAEWLIIVLNIAMVLTAELFNTAIERICDEHSKEIKPSIRIIKDVSAGAVLIIATAAAVIGIFVFLPYLKEFLKLK